MKLLLLSLLAALVVAECHASWSWHELRDETEKRACIMSDHPRNVRIREFYFCLEENSDKIVLINEELEEHPVGYYRNGLAQLATVGFLWLSGVDEDG
jgi:hypothetical protein